MDSLLVLTPLFLAFEAWQLVMGERYLGIKQIARNGDPRTLGMREITAFCWTAALVLYAVWMLTLLAIPYARMHALSLAVVSAIGFSFRRNTGIKRVLVILTIEGAIRVGLLVSLLVLAWHRM